MKHFYRPDGSIKYTEYTSDELEERQRIRERDERVKAAIDRLNTFIEDLELCPDYKEYVKKALAAKEP